MSSSIDDQQQQQPQTAQSFLPPVRATCLLHSTESGGVAPGPSSSWDDDQHINNNAEEFHQEEPGSPPNDVVRVESTTSSISTSSKISSSAVDILLEQDDDDDDDQCNDQQQQADGIMRPNVQQDVEAGSSHHPDDEVVGTDVGRMDVLRSRRNNTISWCRFCGYSAVCCFLMLGLLGLLFGVLAGTNKDCFENGHCRSTIPPAAAQLQVTCDRWFLQTAGDARQYALATCRDMCRAAMCCWQNNTETSANNSTTPPSCRDDPGCRDYDPCQSLWMELGADDTPSPQQQKEEQEMPPLSTNLGMEETEVDQGEVAEQTVATTTIPPAVPKEEEEIVGTDNVDNDNTAASTSINTVAPLEDATAEQIEEACLGINEETTTVETSREECERLCQRGMCCFYAQVGLSEQCPDNVSCDKYEPCAVVGLEGLVQLQEDNHSGAPTSAPP